MCHAAWLRSQRLMAASWGDSTRGPLRALWLLWLYNKARKSVSMYVPESPDGETKDDWLHLRSRERAKNLSWAGSSRCLYSIRFFLGQPKSFFLPDISDDDRLDAKPFTWIWQYRDHSVMIYLEYWMVQHVVFCSRFHVKIMQSHQKILH